MVELNTQPTHQPQWAGVVTAANLSESLRSFGLLLTLQILALWPVWRWYVARLQDGSDEPGLLALSLALLLLYGRHREFRAQPQLIPLLLAGLLTILQAAPWPPLVRALLGVTALGLSIAAFLPRPRDVMPLWALLALSLPLVASLQFYAGYPLRLLAASGASWMLQSLGLAVVTDGAALRLHDHVVLIDAPCSGIHMLWVGLVTVSAASALANVSPLRLLLNTSLAVALVLIGNMLRSAILFLKESGLVSLPSHDTIGLIIFAVVLIPLMLISVQQAVNSPVSIHTLPTETASIKRFSTVAIYAVVVLFLSATVTATFSSAKLTPIATNVTNFEWPTHFQGQRLTRLSMPAREVEWLRDFPGNVASFTDGSRNILMRHVEQPTRMLHPAADCYRGGGYAVGTPEILASENTNWSCFIASKDSKRYSVCENIRDGYGRSWTDASAWYWSALFGDAQGGPWWSTTVAKAVE